MATADQLPPLLVTPPWLETKPRTERKPLTIATQPLPNAMVWQPGQKESWAKAHSWSNYLANNPEADHQQEALRRLGLDAAQLDPQRSPEQLRALLVESTARTHFSGTFLTRLPSDVGLAAWEVAPVHGLLHGYERPERFLAQYELLALPGLVRLVTRTPTETIELCMPFAAAALALPMAQALANVKKARASALGWLVAHPEHAAAGLIPYAVADASPASDAAGAALRLLAANGHDAAIARAAARYNAGVERAVSAVLAFDPLQLVPAKLPKLPPFARPSALGAPLLRGRSAALPSSAVEHLLTVLSFSRLDAPYAGLAVVRQLCDPDSLAQLAWDLFSAWLLAGAPAKEVWAFHALGHFGDDAAARRLAAMVREWPGEAAHARAVVGLDVLAAIGTDVALMHLNGIAQKVKFKGLQERARDRIGAVAAARGLTTDELADRLVPDLGLDERGALVLDFGPRSFTVGFDELLRPFVRDPSGKLLPDLPKPGKRDDAERASAAQAVWKALKKDVKTLAGQQLLRLELGMCARRRWTAEVFRLFLVEHPLLQHVVRRVLWGVYAEDGALAGTFRVSEDGSYADAGDAAFTLPDSAVVGVVHALDLDAAVAARWGQLFADYEIRQPFTQLGRETYTIEAGERDTRKLGRIAGLEVATGKLLGLEERGWRRGSAQDSGCIWWIEKQLPGGHSAHLTMDPGFAVDAIAEHPEQILGEVTIEEAGVMPFGQLDRIVFSELVRDLEALRR